MPALPTIVGGTTLQTEFLFFSGAFCALWIALFVIWILVVVWVYRDAESRKMGGALWAILVFLLGIIGLIIYLVVRGSHPVGGAAPTNLRVCLGCGRQIPLEYMACPYCGRPVAPAGPPAQPPR